MTAVRRQLRGFTLLEILVATAMMGVLAGSFYATLHTAFKARTSAAAAIAPVRKAEFAMELLREDLQSAMVPRGLLAGPLLGQDAVDENGQANDSLTVHCATGAAVQSQSLGDIRKIALFCETTEDTGEKCLVRSVTTNLLATQTQEPPHEIICRGIFAFNLRYFDGADWQDNWDSIAQNNTLPLAVEVTIQLQASPGDPEGQGGYTASRVISIPCSSLRPGVAPGGQDTQGAAQ